MRSKQPAVQLAVPVSVQLAVQLAGWAYGESSAGNLRIEPLASDLRAHLDQYIKNLDFLYNPCILKM
jgi:hypothetical protein